MNLTTYHTSNKSIIEIWHFFQIIELSKNWFYLQQNEMRFILETHSVCSCQPFANLDNQ